MTSTITRGEILAIRAAGLDMTLVETLRSQHFEQGHIPGAIHLHFDDVADRAAALLPDRDALVVTYCSNVTCQNSRMVAEKLASLGYTNVRRYEAGKQDWTDAGLELESAVTA